MENVLYNLSKKYPELFKFNGYPFMGDPSFFKALMHPDDCDLLDKYLLDRSKPCKGLQWTKEQWLLVLPKAVIKHIDNAPIGDNTWIEKFLYKKSRRSKKVLCGSTPDHAGNMNIFGSHFHDAFLLGMVG